MRTRAVSQSGGRRYHASEWGRSGVGVRLADIDALIEDAFAGRELTAPEVQAIAEHVAAAGFDPAWMVQAGEQLEGMRWRGRILTADTRLLPAETHYLKHVRQQEEWPPETTLDRYQRDAAGVARDPAAGVFVSHYQGKETIGVIGRTPDTARGPSGFVLTLIEYRVRTRYWSTAFQVRSGLEYLERDSGRKAFRWLRRMK